MIKFDIQTTSFRVFSPEPKPAEDHRPAPLTTANGTRRIYITPAACKLVGTDNMQEPHRPVWVNS
jgi:hypothetical protein